MKNVYEQCPIYKTDSFILRLVELEDAKDLLACYSDRDVISKCNADYCTSDFYYTTIEQMEDCIRFWLEEIGGMSMIIELKQAEQVANLFEGWQETLIWSCLQGVMGNIYADNEDAPTSAMAMLGDFAFLAGVPNKELALYKPETCKQDFMIMVPQNEAWAEMIEACYGEKAKKVTRYAIKKEPDVFDKDGLQNAVNSLPDGYTIKMIDEKNFLLCKELPWSRDLVSQYDNYETYHKLGLGIVILKDGEPVAGASSYASYNGGIEIEIDTREDERRKGLAYACGAKLILECLERNLYPSWDAQNKWSVALAEKLGYHFDHEYTAYEIWGY